MALVDGLGAVPQRGMRRSVSRLRGGVRRPWGSGKGLWGGVSRLLRCERRLWGCVRG